MNISMSPIDCSEYDPWEYGGFASPKLYYEKMLTLYADGGNLKKVKILIKAGIEVNAQEEEDGDSALMKVTSCCFRTNMHA